MLMVMGDILEQGRKRPHERKGLKYQDLAQDCTEKGWQRWIRVSFTAAFMDNVHFIGSIGEGPEGS